MDRAGKYCGANVDGEKHIEPRMGDFVDRFRNVNCRWLMVIHVAVMLVDCSLVFSAFLLFFFLFDLGPCWSCANIGAVSSF